MIAYHGLETNKDDILTQIKRHRLADEITKGFYWQDGKGCAVGCTIHSSNHIDYEERFGIPVMLARMEDKIFEGLPNRLAKMWPERFMGAIKPGADLSDVGWQLLHWVLSNNTDESKFHNKEVKDAAIYCADVLLPIMIGRLPGAFEAGSVATELVEKSLVRAGILPGCSRNRVLNAAYAIRDTAQSAIWTTRNCPQTAAAMAGNALMNTSFSATKKVFIPMADKMIKLLERAPTP